MGDTPIIQRDCTDVGENISIARHFGSHAQIRIAGRFIGEERASAGLHLLGQVVLGQLTHADLHYPQRSQ